jgi:hypothetical protein
VGRGGAAGGARARNAACKVGLVRAKRRTNVAHLAEQIMIIREHALDKLESECLLEVLKLQELWGSPLPRRHKSSKIANASRAAGPSVCVVPSGRVIGSSSLAWSRRRSSSTTLSTTNMNELA